MKNLLSWQITEPIFQMVNEDTTMTKYEYRLTDIALIVVVTAAVTALATFCLTEYNLRLDCETVAAFRIDGTGFKCEEIK